MVRITKIIVIARESVERRERVMATMETRVPYGLIVHFR
jgi:hypothetical protein